MKKLFLLLVLFWANVGFGQTDSLLKPSKFIVKIAPLSFIDPHNTFQAGVEFRIKPRLSFQTEFGYGNYKIVRVGANDSPTYPNLEIWRWRNEIRKYFSKKTQRPFERGYWAAELLLKQVDAQKEFAIGRGCTSLSWWDGGNCAYTEYRNLLIYKFVGAAHFKIGHQFYLSNNPKTYFDLYFGLGIRSKYTPDILAKIPRNYEGEIISNPFWSRHGFDEFTPNNRTMWFPSLSFGCKIGFGL